MATGDWRATTIQHELALEPHEHRPAIYLEWNGTTLESTALTIPLSPAPLSLSLAPLGAIGGKAGLYHTEKSCELSTDDTSQGEMGWVKSRGGW